MDVTRRASLIALSVKRISFRVTVDYSDKRRRLQVGKRIALSWITAGLSTEIQAHSLL